MRKHPRIIAILPAYNAAKTLASFCKKMPKGLFKEVILIDDASEDETFKLAKKVKGIKVFRNNKNLGYGGNMKRCLDLALKSGADIIIELHPDGEYGFDGIIPAMKQIRKGAKFVLGNRFSNNPLNHGMPFWKYPFAKGLSLIANLILGTKIPDLHQGFRVYTKEMLTQINFRKCSNDYLFSFEIITQAVFQKIPIASIPVTVHYTGNKRGASLSSSIAYSLGVLKILLKT